MVVIALPSTCTASTLQDFTDRPSSSTVQAPQFEVSQPIGRADQAEIVAQPVHQQRARLHLALPLHAVDIDADPHHPVAPPFLGSAA